MPEPDDRGAGETQVARDGDHQAAVGREPQADRERSPTLQGSVSDGKATIWRPMAA